MKATPEVILPVPHSFATSLILPFLRPYPSRFSEIFLINGHSPYTMSGTFSKNDVASHSKPDNLWIIVDEDVYDLTKFQVCC